MAKEREKVPVNVAARELGVSKSYAYRLIRRNDLAAENPGQRQTQVFRESLVALKQRRNKI
ncbi:MAG: helix-turn-helix domain-containing protein [Desulfobaccales bacterium]